MDSAALKDLNSTENFLDTCDIDKKEISVLESLEVEKKSALINKKLLPVKCHYFFDSAATSCILPFASIYAKQLGVSVSLVGIVESVTPFLSIISKPLLGAVADYFQAIKITMLIIMFLRGFSTLVIPFTPIKSPDTLLLEVSLTCFHVWTFELKQNISSWQCRDDQSFTCTTQCSYCSHGVLHHDIQEMVNLTDIRNFTMCQLSQVNLTYTNFDNPEFRIVSEKIACLPRFNATCTLTCPNINKCYKNLNNSISLQFWLYLIMRITYTAFGTMITTLTDAACYELLENKIGHYGRQRLFASLGWGVFSIITGMLMDSFPKQEKSNFAIGVYIMALLTVLDFAAILKIPIKAITPSENILKDVTKLFTSIEAVVFMVSCVVCGGLEALNSSYLFWYLEDMGATKTLVALTLTVSTLLSEIPLFWFTGIIVEKIGNFLCIVIVLMVFSFRHLCYSFIYNPWLAVPVALCHGITFGLFYTSMTSYAKISAKKGTEATMQGLLGGLYRGLGVAIGSLLAGYSFDEFGGRITFRISGATAGLAGVIMFLVYLRIQFMRKRQRNKEQLYTRNEDRFMP